MSGYIRIIIPVVAILIGFLVHRWVNTKYDYVCRNCGNIFSLSGWQAAFSPHRMGEKLVKCPGCGHTGWAAPVPK